MTADRRFHSWLRCVLGLLAGVAFFTAPVAGASKDVTRGAAVSDVTAAVSHVTGAAARHLPHAVAGIVRHRPVDASSAVLGAALTVAAGCLFALARITSRVRGASRRAWSARAPPVRCS